MAKRTSASTTAAQSAATSKKASPAKPVVEKAEAAAPKAASRAKTAAPQVTFTITPDAIAHRAYEIWQRKGGAELENWLQAERELRGETAGK